MRVALPICRGRISPVFDVAQSLRLIDVDDRAVISRGNLTIEKNPALALDKHGVKVLICAGISREMENSVRAQGLEVISGICGSLDEVVEAYVAGRLCDGKFVMPGGWRHRRGRRKIATGSRNMGGAQRRTPSEP